MVLLCLMTSMKVNESCSVHLKKKSHLPNYIYFFTLLLLPMDSLLLHLVDFFLYRKISDLITRKSGV